MPTYEQLKRATRIEQDAMQSITYENWMDRSLNDFFNARMYNTTTGEFVRRGDIDIDSLWTSAGLTVPSGYKWLSMISRVLKMYPAITVEGKLPTRNTVALGHFGLEASTQHKIQDFTFASTDAGPGGQLMARCVPPNVSGEVRLDLTNLIPADYDTADHLYTIKANKPNAEFYVDNTLVAVCLVGVPEAIPVWEGNAPYALGSVPIGINGEFASKVEVHDGGNEATLPVTMSHRAPGGSLNHIVSTDGDPLPPRQYQIYDENSSTKWLSYGTGGGQKTSHPIPIWGYQKKSLVFMADAAGTLQLQIYVGGGWRDVFNDTITANELWDYQLNIEAPIARFIYTPANSDTITLAECSLS